MTSTEHLQSQPDSYASLEDAVKLYKQTNKRYSRFKQVHFTAGDDEQFQSFRSKDIFESTFLRNEVEEDYEWGEFWHKFGNLNAQSVDNSFNYIFHKFKKGLFFQLSSGRLTTMLPFSKYHYTNEWSDNFNCPSNSFFRDICLRQNRVFHPKRVNYNTNEWYANNALLRYEFPCKENDTNVSILKDMFEELSLKRTTPNIEFFINKRDFPLIRRDGKESYNCLFGTTNLLSHEYPTYAPILSMCKTDEYADILIPTHDDWGRVRAEEGVYLLDCPKMFEDFKVDNFYQWDDKINVAVFRGSSTGIGVDVHSNMRLKVCLMSKNCDYLDAGITKWNLRPRKIEDDRYLKTIDEQLMDEIGTTSFLSPIEQSKYKYIINIDGHVSAFRLSWELSTGSVILKVQSPYKLWYSHLLKPYIHFIPIKEDCSDLIQQIEWCKENDDKCREIAVRALEFYNTYLTKGGILDYLEKLIHTLKDFGGSYTYLKSPLEIQQQMEKQIIQPTTNTNTPKLKQVFYENHKTRIWISQRHLIKEGNISLSHEAFIGLKCINPIRLPTFQKIETIEQMSETYYLTKQNVKGETLQSYLSSSKFQMNDYIQLLFQISVSIDFVQKQCLFTHMDLYPWNIIVRKREKELILPFKGDYYSVQSTWMPIIIDYGNSQACYEFVFYGKIKLFEFQRIHDILTILISSLYVILKQQRLNKDDLSKVFKLVSFFSNSSFANYQQFTTLKQLKTFLKRRKRFSDIIDTPKGELENETAETFIEFLKLTFKEQLQLTKHPQQQHPQQPTIPIPQSVYSHLEWIGTSVKCLPPPLTASIFTRFELMQRWWEQTKDMEMLPSDFLTLRRVVETIPPKNRDPIHFKILEINPIDYLLYNTRLKTFRIYSNRILFS